MMTCSRMVIHANDVITSRRERLAWMCKVTKRSVRYCCANFCYLSLHYPHFPLSASFLPFFGQFARSMMNETNPSCQTSTKTMDQQIYKIHNEDDFDRITKGIKVARCMQSPSSYGGKHVLLKFLATRRHLFNAK